MTDVYASHKLVYGKTTGGLTVSKDEAPSTYFLPDPGLPTLWTWSEDDRRYEVVLPKGCILALTVDDDGDGATVPVLTYCTQEDNPIGVAQYHLFRPFDKGTSQGAGWIRRGYLKYPFIPDVLTPGTIDDGASPPVVFNDHIKPGDYVMSDDYGRMTKWVSEIDVDTGEGFYPEKIVGQVIDIQAFGATYDTKLLEWLRFPTEDFQDKLHTLTEERPFLYTDDYVAMFETGVTASTEGDMQGIDDALDRYGALGMVTIVLKL